MSFKDFLRVNAFVAWLIGILIVLSLVSFGVWAVLYPTQLGVERNAVENSKSFTDSTNLALVNYMQDYQKLETKIAETRGNETLVSAYRGQQVSDLDAICQTMARMRRDTVSPIVNAFVAQHGGCK